MAEPTKVPVLAKRFLLVIEEERPAKDIRGLLAPTFRSAQVYPVPPDTNKIRPPKTTPVGAAPGPHPATPGLAPSVGESPASGEASAPDTLAPKPDIVPSPLNVEGDHVVPPLSHPRAVPSLASGDGLPPDVAALPPATHGDLMGDTDEDTWALTDKEKADFTERVLTRVPDWNLKLTDDTCPQCHREHTIAVIGVEEFVQTFELPEEQQYYCTDCSPREAHQAETIVAYVKSLGAVGLIARVHPENGGSMIMMSATHH